MEAEYQRLQDAAREIDREIAELEQGHCVSSAAELAAIERRPDELSVKRSSLAKAMILWRSVQAREMEAQQREFVQGMPHKYHSHGWRRKVVSLPGGVEVTLYLTCVHRQKDPARAVGSRIEECFRHC